MPSPLWPKEATTIGGTTATTGVTTTGGVTIATTTVGGIIGGTITGTTAGGATTIHLAIGTGAFGRDGLNGAGALGGAGTNYK